MQTKDKKFLKVILIVLCVVLIIPMFSGCNRAEKERELRDIISTFSKKGSYVLISQSEYVSPSRNINFRESVSNKLSLDRKVVYDDINKRKFQNNLTEKSVIFSYKYNKKNDINYYAIGYMGIHNFDLSLYYLESTAFDIYPMYASSGYVCFKAQYPLSYTVVGGVQIFNDSKADDYLILNKQTGEIITETSEKVAKENYFQNLEGSIRKDTFIYGNKEYKVYHSNLKVINDEEIAQYIEVPTYEEILLKSEELKKIDKIVKDDTYEKTSYFLTTGDELFVAIESPLTMFGKGLLCPILFKCDINFESFEYVGCLEDRIEAVYKI